MESFFSVGKCKCVIYNNTLTLVRAFLRGGGVHFTVCENLCCFIVTFAALQCETVRVGLELGNMDVNI